MPWVVGGVLVLIVLVMGAGALGLAGTTVEVSESSVVSPAQAFPADSTYGVVQHTAKTKSGLGVFGLELGSSEWAAFVLVLLPEGCEAQMGSVLSADGACSAVPVTGEISGEGVGLDGREHILVTVPIPRACFEAIEPGARWPSHLTACQ
jgi:hypothetical protein